MGWRNIVKMLSHFFLNLNALNLKFCLPRFALTSSYLAVFESKSWRKYQLFCWVCRPIRLETLVFNACRKITCLGLHRAILFENTSLCFTALLTQSWRFQWESQEKGVCWRWGKGDQRPTGNPFFHAIGLNLLTLVSYCFYSWFTL